MGVTNFDEYRDVFVVADTIDDVVHPVTYELIGSPSYCQGIGPTRSSYAAWRECSIRGGGTCGTWCGYCSRF